MPTIKVNGVELFYKESGGGPETIVFSHGLLMDHTMFEFQRAAFESRYRVIAYDHRGKATPVFLIPVMTWIQWLKTRLL